jgi:aminoglycoside phosphotransferase family enzyme
MDLDYHGRYDLSKHFVNAYVNVSRDEELLTLLDFYKCYRAHVRGKVEGFKLDDPNISEEEKARTLIIARRYFELAESYI